MHLCFDIDNTITIWNHDRDYENFKPDTEMVSMINKLYDEYLDDNEIEMIVETIGNWLFNNIETTLENESKQYLKN